MAVHKITPAEKTSLGKYTATAYCGKFGAGSINGTGVTSGGTDLRDGKDHYVIAAGVGSGLKLGDKVQITPNPFGNDSLSFLVDDHGGAIVGRHIDIYIQDCAKAKAWGRRSVTVQKVPADAWVGAQAEQNGPSLSNPLAAVSTFLGKLSVLFEGNFWLRTFLVIGGAFLLGFGVVMIGKQYAPTAILGSAVGDAVKSVK